MTEVEVREFFAATLGNPPAGDFDVDRAVADGRRARGRRVRRGIAAAGVIVVGMGVAASALVGGSPYQSLVEPSAGMEPTIHVGDSVVFDTRLTASRGDIVTFTLPDSDVTTFGRVVALAGDTVACPAPAAARCSAIQVNGAALNEPFIQPYSIAPFKAVTVPTGQLYVLGENREAANDSRAFGPIASDAVHGVVVSITTPGQEPRQVVGAPPHRTDGSPIDPPPAVPPASSSG